MKITVIVCTFNAGHCLQRTLNSLQNQTLKDFEVIIIDGASLDDTVGVIKEYEKKFKGKLRWISEKDSGIYNAMNKGVRMAKGEYLNIIGAGDWLEKNALEKAADCIRKNPQADAVYGVLRMWDKEKTHSNLVQTHPDALAAVPMQHPALYYKKSLHEKYGLYDESYRIVADYLFCMKAFYIGDAVAVPFDAVVDNYVLDGISSDIDLCAKENFRARRKLGIIPNRFMRFIYKRLGIAY